MKVLISLLSLLLLASCAQRNHEHEPSMPDDWREWGLKVEERIDSLESRPPVDLGGVESHLARLESRTEPTPAIPAWVAASIKDLRASALDLEARVRRIESCLGLLPLLILSTGATCAEYE